MSGGKQRQRPKDDPKGARSAEKSVESRRRRDLKGAAVNLPNWVIEALARTTPRDRVGPALEALGEASAAMADGR